MECYPPYDQVPEEVYEKAKDLLELLNYDLDSEHTCMTPYRLSWYLMNILGVVPAEPVHVTKFDNVDPKVTDMQIVPDIPIWAACSHHLLPFFGHIKFGYIPDKYILGLSKIPMVIQQMAKGPWVQEHLCHAIAGRLQEESGALGVAVVARCQHTCVMLDLDSGDIPFFTTSAVRGVFLEEGHPKPEFLELVGKF